MDFEIVKENLTIKQNLETIGKDVVLEQDYILPDIKPDIISVLCSNGNVFVSKREIINNKVKLEGGVNLFITYLADSGENRVLNPEIIFSELFDTTKGDDESSILENIKIKRIEVKVLNERKISIRVVLDVSINLFKKNNIEILKDIDNFCDLQKLERDVDIKNLVCSGEAKAQIKENVGIDEADEIKEILSVDINLKNTENKISYNKVLVKADCQLKIIYITEDNRVCTASSDIPVMGFIDALNVDESNSCDTNFRVKNMLVRPNSKDEHSIYIEIDFDIFSDVYENRSISLIEDIYGLNSDIEYTTRSANILSSDDEVLKDIAINEKVLIEDINQLFNAEAKVNLSNITSNNGISKFDGEVVVTYLYSSFDNQNLNSKEVKFGFSFDVPEGDNNGISVSLSEDSSFVLLPDSTVETVVNVRVIKNGGKCGDIDIIDNINVNEIQDDDGYSMIIYFVQSGDSLWKIAKKFRSTVDEIARINDIENVDVIDVGQRLYIPRAV
ncbi:MAG: DUF3794 domain-containing protein [Clostridia bacterium]|nr:DUF3794 domain-containing protein [Clostridia bacterium]